MCLKYMLDYKIMFLKSVECFWCLLTECDLVKEVICHGASGSP